MWPVGTSVLVGVIISVIFYRCMWQQSLFPWCDLSEHRCGWKWLFLWRLSQGVHWGWEELYWHWWGGYLSYPKDQNLWINEMSLQIDMIFLWIEIRLFPRNSSGSKFRRWLSNILLTSRLTIKINIQHKAAHSSKPPAVELYQSLCCNMLRSKVKGRIPIIILNVFLCLLETGNYLRLFLQCSYEPCRSTKECINTAPGFKCTGCPPGYEGNTPSGVGVEDTKVKQVWTFSPVYFCCFLPSLFIY